MHDYYLLLLLVLSYNSVSNSVFSALKKNVRSLLDSSRAESRDTPMRSLNNNLQEKDHDDENDQKPAEKDNAQNKIRSDMPPSQNTATTARTEKNIRRSYSDVDPVLNSLEDRRKRHNSKKEKNKSGASSSSEMEMQFWMEDWNEQKNIKKFEVLNTSRPPGHDLNMKMARPSGVSCGDPNQHDLPWGTCMRPAECEEEFRIHRGDSSCGRTLFVCCAIIDTAYDMYQAQDMSFEHDNSLTTDSDEDEEKYKHRHEERIRERLKRKREKNKKKRSKALLKKKIRHGITNVIQEITKLLQRAYRNATALRIKKAKDLMEFIKKMKKEYRKDRERLIDAHEDDIFKYDLAMEDSLKKIRGVNQAFMTNQTFRDIVINGTMNQEELKKLQRMHPVFSMFFKSRRMGGELESAQIGKEELERESTENRKEQSEVEKEPLETGIGEPKLEKELLYQLLVIEEDEPKSKKRAPELLDYDIEYGVLYY